MSKPNLEKWFHEKWGEVIEKAESKWDSLPHRDRVFALVGALIDTLVGADVFTFYEWFPGKRSVEMVEAMLAIGLKREAAALRKINLAFPGGVPSQDDAERESQVDSLSDEAFAPWETIESTFEKWDPKSKERVMLTKLFQWYHEQSV